MENFRLDAWLVPNSLFILDRLCQGLFAPASSFLKKKCCKFVSFCVSQQRPLKCCDPYLLAPLSLPSQHPGHLSCSCNQIVNFVNVNKTFSKCVAQCTHLRAQSSSVSAASYLPCLRYSAPRFFSVVVTVGESTFAAGTKWVTF